MDIRTAYSEYFGGDGELLLYHAPGRVNLVGEHTDYNGGYVFPCALDFGTYAAAKKRDDRRMCFRSVNFELSVDTELSAQLKYDKANGWVNYPLGVIAEFNKLGFTGCGFDILYQGNIPNGAGLSSSASIELATAVFLNDLWDAGLAMPELVRLSQRAENNFVGVNCGIMDQFAVGMGKRDSAILLNCRTMEYRYVPLEIGDCRLIIANTNKRRGLAESKYNERRAECERALAMLKQQLSIGCLGEVDAGMFEANKHLITDGVALNRAAHIVYEDARTLRAVDMLCAGDLVGFGGLLNESHESLKTLYEVTGAELDALAEEAQRLPGVYGSRMTGAGFGGCTVSLVRGDAADGFIAEVGARYKARTGLTADFYVAGTGDGAKRL